MSEVEDINDVLNPEEAVDEADVEFDAPEEEEESSLKEKSASSEGQEPDEAQESGIDPIRQTKLDEDPLTRANQVAHNALTAYQKQQAQLVEMQNRLQNYENVLRNPEALSQLVNQNKPQPSVDTFERRYKSVDDLQTPEDLYNALKEQEEYHNLAMQKQISNLKQEFVKSLKEQELIRVSRERDMTVAQEATNDVQETISQYKVLDKNSGEFDKTVLDNISELYMKADYNPQTGKFLGKVKFSDIAKLVLGSADRVKSRMSQQIQKEIVDKTGARPVRQSKNVEDNSPKSPEAFIAAKIKNLNRRR